MLTFVSIFFAKLFLHQMESFKVFILSTVILVILKALKHRKEHVLIKEI